MDNHDHKQAHHMLALTNKISAIMARKNIAKIVFISMTISKEGELRSLLGGQLCLVHT